MSQGKSETTAVALPDDADLAEQVRLLRAGLFHIDGWCRPRPETMRAIRSLLDAQLLRSWESGGDTAQYTVVNFEITDLGREALRSVNHGH